MIITPPPTLSRLGGQPKLQLIGQRCGQNGQQGTVGSGSPYLNTHSRHLLPGGADAIQIVYSGMAQLPTETPIAPNVFTAVGVTLSGGTGYAVGEIMTYALTTSTGADAVKVMVTAVSSGVPTQWQVVSGGLYNTPLSSGAAQASTTGSGSGATATFTWQAYAVGGHVGIEPVWNSQIFAGQNAVQLVRNGLRPDGQVNWNVLVPMGDLYVSELMPIDVPVGCAIGLRADFLYNNFSLGRTPNLAAYGGPTSANYEEANNISTWYDESYQHTISNSASKCIFQPAAILGIPKIPLPSIVAIGDSRLYGIASGTGVVSSTYDPCDGDGNLGWFEKALSATQGTCFWPWANFGRGSDKLALAMPSNAGLTGRMARLKLLALIKPTAVYLNLSVNDFTSGTGTAAALAYEQQFVQEIRGCGVKYVFTDTTDPVATSTDTFATPTSRPTCCHSLRPRAACSMRAFSRPCPGAPSPMPCAPRSSR